jgi:integrase
VEAVRFIEELKTRKDNLITAGDLSPAQLLDAHLAFARLAERPETSLVDCVKFYCERSAAQTRSVTLEELFNQVLQAKTDLSDSYKRDIRWVKGRMAGLGDRLVSEITRIDILEALAGFPESSRNNHLRTLSGVFRFAKDRDYLAEIPLRASDRTKKKRQEIQVLRVGEVRALLETALEHDQELLPLLLIETFCGVRPAEAQRLLWTDIDFLRKRLTVRAAVSKTATARAIIMEPCVLAWFELYGKRGGVCTGPLAPLSPHVAGARLRRLRARAGYRGRAWKPGALRDSFCSNHLAHFDNIDRLLREAGHSNLRTTKDHYLGLVSKEAAAEFWSLFPSAGEKVVLFAPRR